MCLSICFYISARSCHKLCSSVYSSHRTLKTPESGFRKNGRYSVEGGRCAGRNSSSVLGGIRLNGLPASQAGAHRRLFALSPCGATVSPNPTASSTPPQRVTAIHRRGSRLCFGARALALRLTASQSCLVDGVSSSPEAWKPPTGSPTKMEMGGVH